MDLAGKSQHGFKQKKSTATADVLLQSLIARVADEKNYMCNTKKGNDYSLGAWAHVAWDTIAIVGLFL